MSRALISPALILDFDKVYRTISKQPGAKTPELRTTRGVPFLADAKVARDSRRFISLPHNNRIYQEDWGYTSNSMGRDGQRIRQYSVSLDEWARAVASKQSVAAPRANSAGGTL